MKGSIRQRSKGTWQLRYDAPPDGTGRRRFVSKTFKGNKKDAERALRELLATIENGGYVASDKETVAQFMVRWLETYAATNTTVRTLHGYRGYVERYINPTIGNIQLQSLTARHIQGLYADLLDRGLSSSTVAQLHRIFKQALSHAVRWGTLTQNSAAATTPPRQQRTTIGMWDIESINQFLDAAHDNRFRDVFQLAVLTGLRRSELTGLQWENVDLVTGNLRIVSTLQRITGYGLVKGQPKTAKSRRSVALAPDAINLMHGIRGRQIEQQLKYGELWLNTGYVFTQENGSPVALI